MLYFKCWSDDDDANCEDRKFIKVHRHQRRNAFWKKRIELQRLKYPHFTLHIPLFHYEHPSDRTHWSQPLPAHLNWSVKNCGRPPARFFKTIITPDYERVQQLMAFFPLCCRLSMHWTLKTMSMRQPSPLWRRLMRRKSSRSSPRPERRYYRFILSLSIASAASVYQMLVISSSLCCRQLAYSHVKGDLMHESKGVLL